MKYRRRRCRCCRQWFMPQPHNAYHQRYCTRPDCRKASHRNSQRKWRRRNPGIDAGKENVTRVRDWRADNPGYWRDVNHGQLLRLDIFAPRDLTEKTRVHLRIEQLKTGTLRYLFFPQGIGLQRIAGHLDEALRDFIGDFLLRCYVAS